MDDRKFFSVAQLMDYLGKGVISRQQLYKIIREGKIPVKYIGKKILIPASWVEEFCSTKTEVKYGK